MSCYNAEKTVARAIESILLQTFSQFEFVIIDDCSADQTLSIIRKYEKRDSRIRVVKNEKNLGLSASLNKGIEASKAPIIARMDADDESVPDRLYVQYSHLSDNQHIDIVGSGIVLRDSNGRIVGERILPTFHNDIVKRIFRKPILYHPTILIRKRVFDTIASYNPNLKWAEDADLWYRIYDRVTFSNINRALVIYTVKEKLSIRNALTNIRVKYSNLKRRGIVRLYLFQLIYDTILMSWKVVRYKP